MRKFKHIPTNREFAVKSIGCNAVDGITWGDWEIPMWILENGQDWKEIKEKESLLTTEDGVDLFEPTRVWTVVKESLSLVTSEPRESCKYHLFFEKKENAEKYIDLNSPKYSIKDIVPMINIWAMSDINENQLLNFLAKNENKH